MERPSLGNACRQILDAALAAADPVAAIARHLRLESGALAVGERRYDLKDYRRVLVVGGGKAAIRMSLGVEQVLGDRIHSGRVVVPAHLLASTEKPARI